MKHYNSRHFRYAWLPRNPALLSIPIPTPPEPYVMVTEWEGRPMVLETPDQRPMVTESILPV